MAVDPNFHVNQQSSESIVSSEWTIEKVVRFLEENGFSSITHTFKEHNIYGYRFLNLSTIELNNLIQGSLPKTEVQHLYYCIRTHRNNSELAYSHYNDGTTAMSGQYSRHQQPPVTSSSASQTVTAAAGPAYNGNPNIPITQGPAASETEYDRIKHLIPARKSSNPEHISRIVNEMQYDVSKLRPLYQRTRMRPNGSNQENGNRVPNTSTSSGTASHSTSLTVTPTSSSTSSVTATPASSTSTPSVVAYDWANSPISPRAQPNDPKGGWKITGKRVQQLQSQAGHTSFSTLTQSTTISHPINPPQQTQQPLPPQPQPQPQQPPQHQPQHQHPNPPPPQTQPKPSYPHYTQYPTTPQPLRQRIQVTADSNTFLSLTVTDMIDSNVVKDAILQKLQLEGGHYLYYHENGPMYYHENGDRFYAPLTDDELVSICRMADDRLKDQVLVMHPDHISPPYAKDSRGIYPDIPSDYGYISHYQRPPAAGYQHHHMHYPRQGQPLRHMESFDHQPPQPSYMQYDRASPHNSPEMSTSPRPTGASSRPVPDGGFQMPPAHEFRPPSNNTTPAEEYRDDSGYFDRSYKRSSGRSTSSQEFLNTPHFTPSETSTGKTTPLTTAELWHIRPQQPRPQPSLSSEASCWAVRPKRSLDPLPSSDGTEKGYSNGYNEDDNNNAKPPTTLHNNNNNNGSSAAYPAMWAVPPANSSQTENRLDPRMDPDYQSFAQNELWPVDEDAIEDPHRSNPATPRLQPSTSSETMRTGKRYLHGRHPSGEMSTIGETHEYESDQQQQRLGLSNGNTKEKRVRSVQFATDKPLPVMPPPDEEVERLSLHDEPLDPNDSSSRRSKLHIQIPRNEHDGYGPSPRTPRQQRTPLSATSNTSPISSSQDGMDNEEETWGERPSIEKLYRDIDKYLPDHDLDKEIFIETTPGGGNGSQGASSAGTTAGSATPSHAPRRLQGHKKSVRVVAKEAHRNWRQAMNVIRVNHILRRRSTKMWGRKVEQVKPGMVVDQQAIRDAHSASAYADKPVPTKMQWMRGELIGKGSFGRVYHALNVAAGEWIAVKEVDSPITKSDMLNDKMRSAVDALYREISLLEDLDHENIVQYLGYDYDEDEGHIHIFLEYVPGGSIFSALTKNGRFEEVLVQFFTRQILLGLEYLHDRNIMHRDIKAGNILVDQNGVCKITDFGLSKLSGQDEAYDPNSNTLMKGTVFWMAPEVVKGSSYSAKIDIWSLGCTVIEMLTGKKPWLDLNMLAALYSLGKYQAPPLPEEASDEAKDFLNQCFIINPDDRPTAQDLLVHPFVRQNPSFKFRVCRYVKVSYDYYRTEESKFANHFILIFLYRNT
ncbi:hypothetical protein BDA99DRAFT_88006 [Phascolomyces articulosus]|uniref:Protein kinase domain-containing protein n=1 Tax=Phascolomyces articulosus TaxID=60185 RepID=A0AAD5PD06_9FUNG|nr:hypothetical protein BDA99DRAFT_88006 [Phascolomyces articulosus]